MIYAILILITSMILSLVWLWAGGIDYMSKNYPNYKGEDFLNWGGESDEWDDNQVHTESDFYK